jgi:hypothetical protein
MHVSCMPHIRRDHLPNRDREDLFEPILFSEGEFLSNQQHCRSIKSFRAVGWVGSIARSAR